MENNEEIVKIISENLVYYRKKAHLTQQELAAKINYSDKSVSKWERGDGTPDIFILVQLSKLYGLTVNDFLTTRKKEKVANMYVSKLLITLISVGLVWLVATICFFIFGLINLSRIWLVFIYAIPASFIVAVVFTSIFFNKYLNVFFVSGLIWSVVVAIYITAIDVANIHFLYFVAIPLQIVTILFYILLYRKGKHK